MVWGISITEEGWIQIREALKVLDFESLCKAIGDLNFTLFHGYHDIKGNPYHKGQWAYKRLMKAYKDNRESLENQAYEAIQENDSCDNGGYFYWIDPEGYHKVDIEEGAFMFNDIDERIEILLCPSSGQGEGESIFDHMKALTREIEGLEMVLERDSDIYRFSIPIKKWESLKTELQGFPFYYDDICNLVQYRIKEAYLYI